MNRLRVVRPDEVDRLRRDPVDARTLAAAGEIVADVRERGFEAVVEHARRLDDLAEGDAPLRTRDELEAALASLDPEDRACLERTAARIEAFAKAQKECLLPSTGRSRAARRGTRWRPSTPPAATPRAAGSRSPRRC